MSVFLFSGITDRECREGGYEEGYVVLKGVLRYLSPDLAKQPLPLTNNRAQHSTISLPVSDIAYTSPIESIVCASSYSS